MRRLLAVIVCAATLIGVAPIEAGAAAGYALGEVRHVRVRSHDGVMLDGWVSLPKLRPGEQAPVILNSTPYLGTCMVHPTSTGCFREPASHMKLDGETWWGDGVMHEDQAFAGLGEFPIRWINRGFALASFNIRGSGLSGGCLDAGGPREQRDQKVLVDWLAKQPWSNGRVGMGGLSYPGWTTWQAAVQAPDALKAVVSVAPIVDFGTMHYTPEGARIPAVSFISLTFFPQYANPPLLAGPEGQADYTARVGCRPGREQRRTAMPIVAGDRDSDYYGQRDLRPRLKNVRAAVLQVQANADPGHFFQDRTLTAELDPRVPVREVRGWWGHEFPNGLQGNKAFAGPRTDDGSWPDMVTRWMEFWLMDKGPRPPLGIDHRDQLNTWHRSGAWPPAEARPVVRSIKPGRFRSVTPAHSTTFLPMSFGVTPAGTPAPASALGICTPGTQVMTTLPATSDVLLAGNPAARLRVSSRGPRGVVGMSLVDLAPDFSCASGGGVTWLSGGAADLEHYASGFEAVRFPTKTVRDVPVSLLDTTATIKKGHRLGVVVHHGDFVSTLADPAEYPRITVHPGSQVTLPVVAGTLG